MPVASAEGGGGVVIAQMYPGTTTSGAGKDQEFIEIFNNSDEAINVSDWCIRYMPASYMPGTDDIAGDESLLACLTKPNEGTDLWLSAGSYATFMSNEMRDVIKSQADAYFDAGIYYVRGYIILVDSNNKVVDKLGWDINNGRSDTGWNAIERAAVGMSLKRKTSDFLFVKTSDNSNNEDFEQAEPFLHVSGIYEEEYVVDLCLNLDTLEIPSGYKQDSDGNCYEDLCLNIEDDLNITVPVGHYRDLEGNCYEYDESANLEGIQDTVPEFMIRDGANDCVLEYSPLELTEILPNAIGSDSGNEFIEIYNAGKTSVDLTFYILKIGIGSEKIISFPVGSIIGPGEYMAFSDSELKFTLVNSSSKVVLTAVGGKIFGDTGVYDNPDDGESWAYINGKWEYTNRPTPDLPNLKSIGVEESITDESSALKPCNADQFRNPETNRCKKYEVSSLKPCAEGQYRSAETNRCRKVTLTSSTLKPCEDNQYRSPETNRCRKKVNDTVPSADYKVEPIKDSATTFAGWWALGGVGAVAVGYAAWEWRREIAGLWGKLLGIFRK